MNFRPLILRSTFWVKDYFNGSAVGRHYRDIRTIMEDGMKGELLRQQHIKSILRHVTKHSPFYKQFASADLSEFPVVNKVILRENYNAIKIPVSNIPGQIGEVFIQRTSGSTGTPMAVPQNSIKRNRRVAELKYFGKQSGFKSHEKLIHLRTWNRWQSKTKRQAASENIIPFNITNLGESTLGELCNIIARDKPLAIRGYASSVDLLVRYAVANNLRFPSLKIIIAISETLHEATRELVLEHLKCDIISQYSNEENGILGQEMVGETGNRVFYLNHASYFFEVLKMDEDVPAEYGQLGRIVVTDYFNFAFPMIRYDTGDTGILRESDKYSNGYPVLEGLFGRRIDMVFDTRGNAIHPMAIARILKHYPEIYQWQFIQREKNVYSLKVVLFDGMRLNDNIKIELIKLFGENAAMEVELTNEIAVLSSGKRKSVMNEWKELAF